MGSRRPITKHSCSTAVFKLNPVTCYLIMSLSALEIKAVTASFNAVKGDLGTNIGKVLQKLVADHPDLKPNFAWAAVPTADLLGNAGFKTHAAQVGAGFAEAAANLSNLSACEAYYVPLGSRHKTRGFNASQVPMVSDAFVSALGLTGDDASGWTKVITFVGNSMVKGL